MKLTKPTSVLAAAVVFGTSITISLPGAPAVAEPGDHHCPALLVVGVQGTGESAEDADPRADSGMLSRVMKPMMTMAGSEIDRLYVPYPAGFGGAVAGGDMPFSESVQVAIDRTTDILSQAAERCDTTNFALTGYSQGAYALSLLARDIGAGTGPVAADRIAAVSLFGDPARPSGAGLFPARPGAVQPDPAPGTNGEAVAALPERTAEAPSGGGIGPTADSSSDYGSLNGRVASHCLAGDLACDAPAGAPVTHLVTNIVGQSDLNMDDPVRVLGSVAEAVALTTVKASVVVVNEDIQGETVQELSYEPSQSLSQRLATASDPRTPLPTLGEATNALLKIGTIGLNAVVTVAREVFTPATIAELGAVGLANPPAALGLLATKALAATTTLVPPVTASRWTNQAVQAVQTNVTDNAELLDVSNAVRYWQAAEQHGSYAMPLGAQASAAAWTAMWFAAVAADLAGKPAPFRDGGEVIPDPQIGRVLDIQPEFAAPTSTETAEPSTSAPAPFPTAEPSTSAPAPFPTAEPSTTTETN